jgi:copper homeostasis protein
MILEICVESLESAKAAESGGAQRVELCAALSEGGTTPSAGLISAVRDALTIPIYAMVRPRGGDFFYTADEYRIMREDVEELKRRGVDGVVLGLLHKDGRIDVDRTRDLVQLAYPLGVTFHRAIDWSPNMEEALEQVVATGAERVLTSGGMQTAVQSTDRIRGLVTQAASRIQVMVCGRIRESNIAEIAQKTGATEFHASLRRKTASPVTYRKPGLHLGDEGANEFARYEVSAEDVRALNHALHNQNIPAAD